MLSDHVFSFLGRTITITGREQFIAIALILVAATTWLVQQFRRKRVVIVHRSAVSDQLLYELSRIADALDRIANRPAEQAIAASNIKAEESRGMPFSMLGPQS